MSRHVCAFAFLLSASLIPARAVADPIDRQFSALGTGVVGTTGASGSRGAYTTEVPLDLPPPRGDVPVPVSVVYRGGARIGAAGVGWDVPILAVSRRSNISQNKPRHGTADPTPVPAERIFVDIGSGPMLMSRESENVYRPFDDGYFQLTRTADGWEGRDGAGRTWEFARIPSLHEDDFWPLVRITDRTSVNSVVLEYDVWDQFDGAPVPHDVEDVDTISMRELLLRGVSYSHDATGACPKYRVELSYRP